MYVESGKVVKISFAKQKQIDVDSKWRDARGKGFV